MGKSFTTTSGWAATTGRELHLHHTPSSLSVEAMALSPDGRTLAYVSGSTVYLWEVGTGHRQMGGRELRPAVAGCGGKHL